MEGEGIEGKGAKATGKRASLFRGVGQHGFAVFAARLIIRRSTATQTKQYPLFDFETLSFHFLLYF